MTSSNGNDADDGSTNAVAPDTAHPARPTPREDVVPDTHAPSDAAPAEPAKKAPAPAPTPPRAVPDDPAPRKRTRPFRPTQN